MTLLDVLGHKARHRTELPAWQSALPGSGLERSSSAGAILIAGTLALVTAVSVYGGGAVVLMEVVALLLLPVIFRVVRSDRTLTVLLVAALLWTSSQLLSDFVNQLSPFSDVAVIGLLAVLFTSALIWLHVQFGVSPALLLAAAGLGWAVLELVGGVALATGDPWKYGLATPATLTVVALAYWLRAPRWAVLLVFALLAMIALANDSRFDFGLSLVGAAAAAVTPGRRVHRSRQATLLSALVIVAALLYLAYPSIALSGLLGQRALVQQTRFGDEAVNFLLAARVEFPQVAHLVLQSPWIGIGAHGPLSSDRAYDALAFVNDHVIPLDTNLRTYLLNAQEGYIGYNAHTSAMSAALYAGVLALPFWIVVIAVAVRAVVRVAAGRTIMPALVIYFAGRIMWDTLFSPLYNHTHLLLGVSLAVFLLGMRGAAEEGPSFVSRVLDTAGPARDAAPLILGRSS